MDHDFTHLFSLAFSRLDLGNYVNEAVGVGHCDSL